MSPKAESTGNLALQKIAPLIHEIRGERVILDSDLARIYGVTTKRLNEQVKRNAERFPEDFAFQLSKHEFASLGSQSTTSSRGSNRSQFATSNLKSQIATSSLGHGGKRKLPLVFTEHGAIMAANVLNSKQAVQMSVFVVRAFVKLRDTLATHKELAEKLNELERKVGTHGRAIVSILATIRRMTEPTGKKARAIGFRAKRETGEDRTKQKIAMKHSRKK